MSPPWELAMWLIVAALWGVGIYRASAWISERLPQRCKRRVDR